MTQEEAQQRLHDHILLGEQPLTDAEMITGLSALVVAMAAEVNAANAARQSNGCAPAYDGFYCDAWTMLETIFRNKGLLP